ncbi:predicted protein [Chaetoceros tenuissimus]|uniref:Uncharacterized protein n=1 Tax=Chaetoceros tenuissimus TaxID=426638 RepID=A0AAD3HD89_9STRA|nr:predicted protein [Chaetoceros tenuissimus]
MTEKQNKKTNENFNPSSLETVGFNIFFLTLIVGLYTIIDFSTGCEILKFVEEFGLSQQVQLCSTLLAVVTAILFLCIPIVYAIINHYASPGKFDVNNLTDIYSRDETKASTEMKSKNSISEIFDMDVSVVNQHIAANIPMYPK